MNTLRVACTLLLALCAGPVLATSATGQTGLVHMPDARIQDDGDWLFGVSRMDPYTAVWTSIAILPRLEVSGRFTFIEDVPAFTQFGVEKTFRDKAFDAKILLLRESEWLPSVSIGFQDYVGDSVLFRGNYVAASKRIGDFDVTLGWGDKRFDGLFGGVRWDLPWVPELSLLAEYDGYDYPNDFHARRTGELVREGGLTLGTEYRHGWTRTQLSHQDGTFGINLSIAVPLTQRTFAAKTGEPAPVPVEPAARPALDDWTATPGSLRPVYESLRAEGFGNIILRVDGARIEASVTHARITTIGRAAGRAARIIALHAPNDAHSLELTLTEFRMPLATYRFEDLALYRGWLDGEVSGEELSQTLGIAYTHAGSYRELQHDGIRPAHMFARDDARWIVSTGPVMAGLPILVTRSTPGSAALNINPVRLGLAFNDPAGALHYDLHSQASLSKWFGRGFYGTLTGVLTLSETVSETLGGAESNSVLPHVRSQAPRYLREGRRLRLHSTNIGHLANPADRVYTNLTAGYLELMFAGAGGEVLYLPERGNWAVDFNAYGVRQRDFRGGLGFLDYETVTSLASFHYRVPEYGLTFTTRAGRFLAGDYGARLEVKRRFLSGFELGAWYSYTDGKDITSPGSPDSPYRDKGVFLRFSVGAFMPRDSRAYIPFEMSPWIRDPGQMLRLPLNLYDLYERNLLLNLDDLGPWSDFGY